MTQTCRTSAFGSSSSPILTGHHRPTHTNSACPCTSSQTQSTRLATSRMHLGRRCLRSRRSSSRVRSDSLSKGQGIAYPPPAQGVRASTSTRATFRSSSSSSPTRNSKRSMPDIGVRCSFLRHIRSASPSLSCEQPLTMHIRRAVHAEKPKEFVELLDRFCKE